jgi:hypothetical protein
MRFAVTTDGALGIVKLAPAMVFLALTCACKNLPAPIESRSPVDFATQKSARFIIAGVDNEPVDFMAQAGGTPRGYDLLAGYESTSTARHIMDSLEKEYGLREVSTWPIEPLHMHCAVLQIPKAADRDALLARLLRDPRVKLAQPLQIFAAHTAVPVAHDIESRPHQSTSSLAPSRNRDRRR